MATKRIMMFFCFFIVLTFCFTTACLSEKTSIGQAIELAWRHFSETILANESLSENIGDLYSYEVGIEGIHNSLFGDVWDVQIWEDRTWRHFEALVDMEQFRIVFSTGERDFYLDDEADRYEKYEAKWGRHELWDYKQWHEFGNAEGFSCYILPVPGTISYENAAQIANAVYEKEGGDPAQSFVGSKLRFDVVSSAEWVISFIPDNTDSHADSFHVWIDAVEGVINLATWSE